MRIYFDVCALGRLNDDNTQPRIALEAEAVERLLTQARIGNLFWLTSPAVKAEVLRNTNPLHRTDALLLLEIASESIQPTTQIASRARNLAMDGFGQFDALHLAFAEAGNADALITTDDRFLRRCNRMDILPVCNPVDFLQRWQPWPTS